MTADPVQRWESYLEEYQGQPETMILLHACQTCEASWVFESILIEAFWDAAGSINKMNSDKGGTGRPLKGKLWFYVYLLYWRVGDVLRERMREKRIKL